MNKPLFTMSAQEFQHFIEEGIYSFCDLLDNVTPVEEAVERIAQDVVTGALWHKGRK